MTIDEIITRKQIWLTTYKVLENNGINMYHIIDEFQDRYKPYNLKIYGVESLSNHPNREDEVIKREMSIAIDILKENKIKKPEEYFN